MPTSVGVVSQIQLPNGNIYDLVDRVTPHDQRLEYVIAYKSGVPVVSNIPAGVTVVYNDTAYIGTKVADSTTYSSIYLVKFPSQEDASDYYDEYITLREGTEGSHTYSWEKLGDTRVNIKDITPELRYLQKSSGYVKGYTPSTDTFVKSVTYDTMYAQYGTVTGTDGTESVSKVTKTTKKLVTTSITPVSGSTSIYGVGSTTTTASKATAGTAKNVASAGTAVTVGDGTVTASSTNTDILKSATVSNGTLLLGACTLDTTTVTPAVSNGTITPYTFSDVTVPVKNRSATTVPTAGTAIKVATGKLASSDTNGDTVVDSVTISDKTVAKAASSSTDIVTGFSGDKVSYDAVITGVIPTTGTAVTALGTPTTGDAFYALNTTVTNDKVVVDIGYETNTDVI